MPRYKLVIEYDGTDFVGWQAQSDGLSVQDAIETAICAFVAEKPRLTAAGRTDAGVHARGQVAHFDLSREWLPDVVREATNAHLRKAGARVAILHAEIAPPDFHARFGAKKRHYLYRILARRAPPVLDRNRVWHIARPLDVAAMAEAGSLLLGRHDFTTFRAAGCQAKSAVKTLDVFSCEQAGEEILFRASARSFLHHQIRSMVGSLIEVGIGRWSRDDFAAALAAKDRTRCGPVAPASGLYLIGVDY